LERLFEEAPDIVDSSDYDYEAGSARLLGRDISKIAYTKESLSDQINLLKIDEIMGLFLGNPRFWKKLLFPDSRLDIKYLSFQINLYQK
jgi:hypothetical protein